VGRKGMGERAVRGERGKEEGRKGELVKRKRK